MTHESADQPQREHEEAARAAELREFERDHARQFPGGRVYTETTDEEWWTDA